MEFSLSSCAVVTDVASHYVCVPISRCHFFCVLSARCLRQINMLVGERWSD